MPPTAPPPGPSTPPATVPLTPPPGGAGPLGAGATAAPPRNRRRAPLLVLGAAVVLVLAVVVALLASGGSSPSSSDAAAAVVRSAQASLTSGSAHMTIALSTSIGGHPSVTGSGTGVVDFGQDAADLKMSVGSGSVHLNEEILATGGTAYLGLPQISRLFPGKSWISLTLAGPGSGSDLGQAGLSGGSDSVGALGLLTAPGSTVVPLGTSTVGGTTVRGYRVTIDRSDIRAALQREGAAPWIQSALRDVPVIGTEDVYIDGGGVLCQVVVQTSSTVEGQVAAQTMTVGYSDYGAPVSITAPPAAQVVPLQQFVQATGDGSSLS